MPQLKTARIHRMVIGNQVCPYGLKAKNLLRRNGYIVEDHCLRTREETDTFKKYHSVKTTPQIFIKGNRVGGYDDIRQYLGQNLPEKNKKSYRPVLAIFSIALLMAFATSWFVYKDLLTARTFEWFIAMSMCLLAVQKLQNIESFSTMFLNYDLLARRWVRYGYIYPFAEALAGILMISKTLIWIASPIALFIGTVGTVSIFKAVYIDKRHLKCACTGSGTNVPLGFVSLTENLMMIVMGLWMFFV